MRLLMLVGSLGLVFVLIFRASDPKTWHWIVPPESGSQEVEGQANPKLTQQDIRVERKAVAADNGIEGEFRLAKPRERPVTPYTLGAKGKQPAGEADATDLWASPEALAAVEDNSAFRASGFPAWRQIRDRLQATTITQLESEKAPRVQFGQLFQQSELYRGRLVTVSGTIRRCVKVSPNKLDDQASDMWQLWLFGGSDNFPMVIYCLDLPEGFPVADQMAQRVTLRAIYFKKWVHPAKGGATTSPLLMAKTFRWTTPIEVAQNISSTEIIVGVALTFVVASVVVGFVWWNSRNQDSEVEKRIRQKNRKQFEEHSEELDVGISVRDRLGALAAELQQASSHQQPDDKSPE
ncbi:hypothetical protein DTL42_22800 [Bremerella cremea]|uniref:Uncharacterized protein n=1 Tax=Bremerella cremea TaxID=1031537 RepID=A0A368KKU2_9BACT|nr:hypothetical protein [Bremerella cremea]RCS41391.1 hypothetical protein DTL42_22800 [Bremerella cremea]